MREFLSEEFNFPGNRNAGASGGCAERRRGTEPRRNAGRHHDEVDAFGEKLRDAAERDRNSGMRGKEPLKPRHFLPGVAGRSQPAAPQKILKRSAPGSAETRDKRAAATAHRGVKLQIGLIGRIKHDASLRKENQRILSVESPIRTRMKVMIQKRVTTCVSFQPFSSKW